MRCVRRTPNTSKVPIVIVKWLRRRLPSKFVWSEIILIQLKWLLIRNKQSSVGRSVSSASSLDSSAITFIRSSVTSLRSFHFVWSVWLCCEEQRHRLSMNGGDDKRGNLTALAVTACQVLSVRYDADSGESNWKNVSIEDYDNADVPEQKSTHAVNYFILLHIVKVQSHCLS